MVRKPSQQTLMVLWALADDPTAWRHGYELGRQLGLKAGSLYPILIRLADRGLLETSWEEGTPAGRPRRHLYRLSAAGAEFAAAHPPSVPHARATIRLRTEGAS